jgi:hypothetical protein
VSVSVELVEEEVVRAGGPVTVNWLVRHNDGWVRAPDHPAARSEMLEQTSGVVWRRRVTLELLRGTLLNRLESRPTPGTKSALAYLTTGARGASRRTLRRAYVVGPGGKLVLGPEG